MLHSLIIFAIILLNVLTLGANVSKQVTQFSSIDMELLELSKSDDHTKTLSASMHIVKPQPQSQRRHTGRCALNFYGLPRAFKLVTLPFIIANVIIPNSQYNCDYFVHFYNVSHEPPSRSGKGGPIIPHDVYLLQEAVHRIASAYAAKNHPEQEHQPRLPHVGFTVDTGEAFEQRNRDLLQKIRNNDTRRKNPYHSRQVKSFTTETYVNVIKMWDSIATVWDAMESHANYSKSLDPVLSDTVYYERVAMMRLDVIFVTPIDIFNSSIVPLKRRTFDSNHERTTADNTHKFAVIPEFHSFPCNDRMFIGPFAATKIWATGRFSQLDDWVHQKRAALVSENFLWSQVLPAITAQGVEVVADPHICFLRARADLSVWHDCGKTLTITNRLRKRLNLTVSMEEGRGGKLIQLSA